MDGPLYTECCTEMSTHKTDGTGWKHTLNLIMEKNLKYDKVGTKDNAERKDYLISVVVT